MYKRQTQAAAATDPAAKQALLEQALNAFRAVQPDDKGLRLSLIHISEPTRPY